MRMQGFRTLRLRLTFEPRRSKVSKNRLWGASFTRPSLRQEADQSGFVPESRSCAALPPVIRKSRSRRFVTLQAAMGLMAYPCGRGTVPQGQYVSRDLEQGQSTRAAASLSGNGLTQTCGSHQAQGLETDKAGKAERQMGKPLLAATHADARISYPSATTYF